jgi:predicted nucleic acid-binding protein
VLAFVISPFHSWQFSSPSSAGAELRRMIADTEPFALAGAVVPEIQQCLKGDVFWGARARGIAFTTMDALIAAIALEHGAALFTLDKDFPRIAVMIRLPLYAF